MKYLLAESRSPLYASEAPAELHLQAGKIQNLRIAAQYLDGIVVPANETFSFWAQVPRPTRGRGFVAGRELREGCIIPSVGGGLCQLSNALFDAALTSGLEIVERHAHSRTIPGSAAEKGRDATIFWNYVDLRFRSASTFRIGVQLTDRELVVKITSQNEITAGGRLPEHVSGNPEPEVESCETCGVTSCFRHIHSPVKSNLTAWLVDAWTPEFNLYLESEHAGGDWLFVPLDGKRYRLRNYRWNSANFQSVRQAPWEVVVRSILSRRLAAQGARRQRAQIRFDEALASRYARNLPVLATHLVVSQNLLPILWRKGILGGRTFDVLMTRLPAHELQASLDSAFIRYPESNTLADFRAPAGYVEDEREALDAARHWITPHSAILKLAGPRARKLDWILPSKSNCRCSPDAPLLFPASTLARKGAYELREAARLLHLQVYLEGPCIEDPDFWAGIQTNRITEWPAELSSVVLPAWVEHQPRRLLRAVASGIPVIATDACGLDGLPGVTIVPRGDIDALVNALNIATAAPAVHPSCDNNRG